MPLPNVQIQFAEIATGQAEDCPQNSSLVKVCLEETRVPGNLGEGEAKLPLSQPNSLHIDYQHACMIRYRCIIVRSARFREPSKVSLEITGVKWEIHLTRIKV